MNLRKLILTFFGAGLSPVAPGTVGSLAAVAVLYAVTFAQPSPLAWQGILVGGLVVSSVLMIKLGRWMVLHFRKTDPQQVVLDEVAGICLTAIGLPMRGDHGWITLAAVFAAFRLFDVTKPPPARQLEFLPFGWGVLLDDLAAAVYANLVCQVGLRLL